MAVVCAGVIGVYAYMAQSSGLELQRPDAADAYYNLLVQGFRAGQLSLKKEVPSEFARLADPYDPSAHLPYQGPPYRMGDLSYYRGRMYLYFGVAPALILFWPFAALTGHYLSHSQAVTIFCALGFLTSVGLLCAMWRRYFAEVNVVVVAACALALGLTTGVPVLESWSGVHEVPISCGYLLTMLALAAIWCALHEPERRGSWLTAASVAYGLAVGARPSLLFGAVILVVPLIQSWRGRQKIGAQLVAAFLPIAFIGLGLVLYNDRRFGNPFEFGMHYQLNEERLIGRQFFSVHYLWFNFRMFFLEPARWSVHFPFVHNIPVPPVPAGYTQFRNPFGVLTNIPVVWLALAAPLAWRNRLGEADSTLRGFVTAIALLFGTCAVTIALFGGASFRYEVDFLPALVCLAVIGILGVEHVLMDRPVWRRAARWGWGLLLGFSVVFNVLATADHFAEAHCNLGLQLGRANRVPEAIEQYKQALRIEPEYADAHYNLGLNLSRSGKAEEALEHYKLALQIKPDYVEADNNLGERLIHQGRIAEAIEHLEHAVRVKPDYAEAQNNLGVALGMEGRVPEAMEHLEEAVRIKPDYGEAHFNLGIALGVAGRFPEAIGHFEQALRIRPDNAAAHCNLGIALERTGNVKEAIGHYKEALRLKPDYAEARDALARLKDRQ